MAVYQALYRKWRPRTFDDVVGQGHITDTLRRQVDMERLSHAYLFTGTRGTGKTTCAKILARSVNCQAPRNGNPCNACPACLGIESGAVLDVLELDAASNNRVDDVRAILDEAVYTPATVKKRVYIVDEVHMLSGQAFNALLQILEEPPAHLMFILATTEIHKVPATIKSRCQQFSFKRIRAEEIAGRLRHVAEQEGIDLTEGGAALLARLADGGMRDALSLLDQCVGSEGTVDEEQVYHCLGLAGNLEAAALLGCVADGDGAQALERLSGLYRGGKEMAALAGELAALTRDLLIRKTAPRTGEQLMTGGFDESTLRGLAARFDIPRLVQMLRLLQSTGAEMSRSPNRRTDMELCLLTLCDPRLDSTPTGLNERLSRLEQGMAPATAGKLSVPQPESGLPQPIPVARPLSPPGPASEMDAPPWQMDETAPTAERNGPAPISPSEPKESAPPRPMGGGWSGWSGLRERLRSRLTVGDYSFLGNAALAEGCLEGDTLTIWVVNDFIKGQLDRPALLEQVALAAGELTGRAVLVKTAVGPAPAERPAAAAWEPPQDEEDALEAFLARGLDNLTVE